MAFRWATTDLLLTYEYSETLGDADWDALLTALAERAGPPTGLRVIVFNATGGPNASQRARFSQRLRGRPVRIAVLCTSPFTQALTKAFQSMGFPQVSAFAPDQEEAAFRHLNLTPPEIARVRELVPLLRGGPKSNP